MRQTADSANMKRGGHVLVEIENGYEKAISRSKLAVERNANLLEVTVPIGVIRSLAKTRALPAARAARGSAPMWETARAPSPRAPLPPAPLRRIELALMSAILVVFLASLVITLI